MSGSNLPLDLRVVPGEGDISKCPLLGQSKSPVDSQHDWQRETLAMRCSKEAGTVVWFSQILKSFLLFVVIHRVKGFNVVQEAEVDIFSGIPLLFLDPADIGNLISGSSFFSKSSLSIWRFSVHILLKPSLKDLEHYLGSM